MKNIVRYLSLALVLIFALAAALAETETEAPVEDALLVSVEGEELYESEVEQYREFLIANGYAELNTSYEDIIRDLLLNDVLVKLKVREHGAEALLGEAYAGVEQAARDEFNGYIEQYADSLAMGQELTDEERAANIEQSLQYFGGMGYDIDTYAYEYVSMKAFEALIGTYDFTPDAAAIDAAIADYIEMCKREIGDDAEMYETYTNYYGYEIPYLPAGYRGVTHILLEVDEALVTAFNEASDEALKAEAGAQMVSSIKEKIDEIYAKLAEGESFESLIALYGTDPGMTGENLTSGYMVHADSMLYDTAFTNAAFSDKMLAVGDVSDPAPSSFGVHILYYLRDVPSGAQQVSDGLKEALAEQAAYSMQAAQMESWLNEYEITYTDAYAAKIAE